MRRALLRALGAFAALLLLAAAVFAWIVLREDGTDLAARKGALDRVVVGADDGDAELERIDVDLTSDSGLTAEAELLAPRDKTRRHPAVVLLAGKGTGKHAVDAATGFGDLVLLALEYHIDVQRSYDTLGAIEAAPAVRRQALDVVPSVMLAADYLLRRPDVDGSRLILLGYSFGALYVPCIAALDHRFAAAAMVDGGGDLGSLVRVSLEGRYDPVTTRAAGVLAGLLLRPVEPTRFVAAIAPRPFVMINSRADERIPRASAEALFHRARQPKRMDWLDAGHVDTWDSELIRRTTRRVARELRELGILEAPGGAQPAGAGAGGVAVNRPR